MKFYCPICNQQYKYEDFVKKYGTHFCFKCDSKLSFTKPKNTNFMWILYSWNLKDKCSMYMVNRAERIADIIELARKYKLEPKEVQFVHSKVKEPPVLVLVKATKNANRFLKIREPLYIYNEDGSYTDEVLKIYGKL